MHKVLYIEDNIVNIQLVQYMLRKSDFSVIHAMDGQTGLELAEQIKPDVIVIDYHMPGMNGLEVVEKIKSNPDLANIPLIALTADTLPETYRACKQAGFNAYLNKPLSRGLFLDTLNKLVVKPMMIE
ncbi:MAG: response regulator [Chloroflexi bacterium]|nr:MAG: response regulator [Chloroflexota bacterium]